MAKRKGWEESPVTDGIGEVRLASWGDFPDYIYKEMLDYETYIWRGHRCEDWLLEPTLDRLIKKAKMPVEAEAGFRTSHFDRFKYAVRGRRGPNPTPINEENEWWALGQHHGLVTPLLDWTTSPFVGAYFCFIETGDNQTDYRALFALHKPSVERKAAELKSHEIFEKEIARAKEKEKIKEEMKMGIVGPEDAGIILRKAFADLPVEWPRPQVEFIRPLSDENQKLINQAGLFTRGPNGVSLEDWIRTNFKGEKYYILIKILILNKDREKCLRMLNRMNINHLTLFPDLYGASKYCNLFGEIEGY